MGKRLTEQEKEEKLIEKVVSRIICLEKVYPSRIVERACYRYKNAALERRNALKEKAELEERLAEANKILKK